MTHGSPMPHDAARIHEACLELVSQLSSLGASLAIAESVTGGRVTSALTAVAGSSAVVRGAVVAYAAPVKVDLLGVDPTVLRTQSPVCAEVAAQMARGVLRLLGTTVAVATTGEAGPHSASGQPVGTVFVAVSGPAGTRTRLVHRVGTERASIQESAVLAVLELLAEYIRILPRNPGLPQDPG